MMLYELSGGSAIADRQAAAAATGNGNGNGNAKRVGPLLSIIVPTRDEAGNVEALLTELEQAAPGLPAEIIFVDDSDDDATAEAVADAGSRCLREVGIIHRPPERRGDGLGGAVLEGLWVSRGAWVCVMDGDLQHPPALITDMLSEADRTDADLVVASRRAPHGDADGLPLLRAGISRTFTRLTRALFGKSLGGVSDPMSGFFLVRRSALDLEALDPHGFKVLLDILVRTPGLRVSEVPFHFGERHAGASKADTREGLRFLRLLWRLRIGDTVAHFARFGLVGLTGLAVNTLVLALLTGGLGVYYLAGAILATQVSTLWLFALTDLWVFRDRTAGRSRLKRLGLYALMNNAALLLRGPLLVLLVSGLGVQYLLGNVISLVLLTVVRYGVADVWIWARDPLGHEAVATHDYDIHGLLSVRSEVSLPELEGFRVKRALTRPNIDVKLGLPAANGNGNHNGHVEVSSNGSNGHGPERRIRYREGFPGLGFGVEIVIGQRIEVTASPALRFSPHVLYTNVVEPILRWTFVEKGHALVHGACLADGDGRALLITARTDTGKTTTTLKALENHAQPWSFLSDDLTLVAADGRVLAYPKPLTISRHTVKAVKRAALSRRERMGLLVQSKIHSRSGRRVAMRIARLRLPAATINLVVQALIPPPKYFVERLVPGVAHARQARLAGMVVIQRDGDGATVMGAEEALETLMANCADAYGFPPYAEIEGFLNNNGRDLRADERAIVAAALAGVRTTLLKSRTMDWWQGLPSVADGVG